MADIEYSGDYAPLIIDPEKRLWVTLANNTPSPIDLQLQLDRIEAMLKQLIEDREK